MIHRTRGYEDDEDEGRDLSRCSGKYLNSLKDNENEIESVPFLLPSPSANLQIKRFLFPFSFQSALARASTIEREREVFTHPSHSRSIIPLDPPVSFIQFLPQDGFIPLIPPITQHRIPPLPHLDFLHVRPGDE